MYSLTTWAREAHLVWDSKPVTIIIIIIRPFSFFFLPGSCQVLEQQGGDKRTSVQHREFHRILHVESPFSSLGESHVGFWPTIETVTQVREACSLCTKIYSYRGFFTVTVLIAFNGIFFPQLFSCICCLLSSWAKRWNEIGLVKPGCQAPQPLTLVA